MTTNLSPFGSVVLLDPSGGEMAYGRSLSVSAPTLPPIHPSFAVISCGRRRLVTTYCGKFASRRCGADDSGIGAGHEPEGRARQDRAGGACKAGDGGSSRRRISGTTAPALLRFAGACRGAWGGSRPSLPQNANRRRWRHRRRRPPEAGPFFLCHGYAMGDAAELQRPFRCDVFQLPLPRRARI